MVQTPEQRKASYQRNKHKKKAYYEANIEKIRKRVNAYYQQNKELFKARAEANKEHIRDLNKKYHSKLKETNPEKLKEYYRDSYNKKKSIPEKHTIIKIRNRIRNFLNSSGSSKRSNTQELIGCDPNSLKKYLEKQFQEGMSWDNRDMWDIDHIIPLNFFYNFFDIKKIDIQKIAFHYSNLQPLFKKDNIRKQDNIYIENVEDRLGERVILNTKNEDTQLFVFILIEKIEKKLDTLKKKNTIKDIGKLVEVSTRDLDKLVNDSTKFNKWLKVRDLE